MAYLDPTALRLPLAGTENASGTAASLSDPDLTDAISEAQTEVDGRLAGRYTTPFTNPPALVVNITRDIAAYLATLTYRRGNPIPPGDPVLLRYTRAQTLLGQAANGSITIDADPPAGETVSGGTPTANPYTGSLFGGPAYLRDVPVCPDEPAVPASRVPTYIPPPYGY